MTNKIDSEQSAIVDKLLRTGKLHAFNEIAEASKEVAGKPGIYSWWFKEVPPVIPIEGTIIRENKWLLYVGIGGDLRKRLKNHLAPRCSSSTLRYSLAATLADNLDIQGTYRLSGKKKTKKILLLKDGEQKLTEWMGTNAYVSWVVCDDPRAIELKLLEGKTDGAARFPINMTRLSGEFRHELRAFRKKLKCSG